jgi:hypothetical protein
MDIIGNILEQAAYCINNKEYLWIDSQKLVLAGNCHTPSQWFELLVSINAFLNGKGGVVIIGIADDEDNNRLVFEGFDANTTRQLHSVASAYTDENSTPLNLEDRFSFGLKPFLEGEVMAVIISPLQENEEPIFYQGNAWQRTITGNHRIKGNLPNPYTSNTPDPLPASTTDNDTFVPDVENVHPIQKIYSSELITLFGTDYISLEPDFKQLLSFIYEKNNDAEANFPSTAEISSKLWVLRGEVGTKKAYEMYGDKVKKIIAQMEKSSFILRQGGKAEYKINTTYKLVRNLFN